MNENNLHVIPEATEDTPFSPDFGIAPPFMAGRERLLSRMVKGLGQGAGKGGFTSVVSGVRGSGKTVLLQTIQEQARNSGWLVLPIGDSQDLLFSILEVLDDISEQYEWLDMSAFPGTRTLTKTQGINLGGLSAGRTSTESENRGNNVGLHSILWHLAKTGAAHRSVVLLTIDELHSIDRVEARKLFTGIQQVTKGERLPLAFMGAGLPDMHYTLFKEKSLTFFRRCRKYQLPPLTFEQTLEGIKKPIEDYGGRVNEDALILMSEHVKGLPYAVQTVGHAAWEIADAPDNPIDMRTAEEAIAVSEEILAQDIHLPSLDDLSRTEREYLIAITRLGSNTSDASIRKNVKMDPHEIYEAERRLITSGFVIKTKDGTRELTGLVPREILLSKTNMMDIQLRIAPEGLIPEPRSRCGRLMPRAKKHCVLPAGHRGVCRSKQ